MKTTLPPVSDAPADISRRRHPVLMTLTSATPRPSRHVLERIERHRSGWIPVFRCQTTRTLRAYGLHARGLGLTDLRRLYGPLVWDEWRESLLAQPMETVCPSKCR